MRANSDFYEVDQTFKIMSIKVNKMNKKNEVESNS